MQAVCFKLHRVIELLLWRQHNKNFSTLHCYTGIILEYFYWKFKIKLRILCYWWYNVICIITRYKNIIRHMTLITKIFRNLFLLYFGEEILISNSERRSISDAVLSSYSWIAFSYLHIEAIGKEDSFGDIQGVYQIYVTVPPSVNFISKRVSRGGGIFQNIYPAPIRKFCLRLGK